MEDGATGPAARRHAVAGRLTPGPTLAAIAALTVIAVVVIPASPGSAHAVLESTAPAPSDVVTPTPAQVVLQFDAAVLITPASLRLFDSRGDRLDHRDAHHPRYSTTPTATPSEAQLLAGKLSRRGGSPLVGALYWLVRALAFAGVIGLVGVGTVLTACWRDGWSSEPLRKAVSWSWVVLLGSTVAAIALQGIYAAGLPLTRIFSWSLLLSTLKSRFGVAQIIEAVFLVLAALLLEVRDSYDPRRGATVPRWWAGAGLVVAAGLVAAPLVTGHASSGRWVVVGAVTAFFHYAAVSVWVGALVLLGVAFARAPERVDLGPAVPRISNLIYCAVGVTVASGIVQSLRQVGSLGALATTAYGRTLLVKVGIACVLVGLGAASRRLVHGRLRLVPGRPGGAGRLLSAATATGTRLRRLVAAELALSVVVLGATSLLVNAAPPAGALAQPVAQTVSVAGVDVTVVIEPARAGPNNQFHILTVLPNGLPADVSQMQASLSLPGKSIGPFFIPLIDAGLAHFIAESVDIPIPGNWLLRLVVRTSPTSVRTVTSTVTIH